MTTTTLPNGALASAIDAAIRAIPPVWPLATSVAVNPFLGQAGEPLAVTAARLGRVGGLPVTMPRAWFAGKIAAGEIAEEDLQAALDASVDTERPASVAALRPCSSSRVTPTW